jgi:PAS domain S-box-containing protein
LAAAPDALLAVDASGTILFVNDQVERLFGWTSKELVGKAVELLVPERYAGRHPELRGGYFAKPTTRPMGANLELWSRRRDGSEFPAEISLSSFETSGNVLTAAAIRDATDRLEFEADRQQQALAVQREQSHRLESLGQLAGGVAHDFNNLLGVILIYTRLLSRQVSEPSQVADLEEIRIAADRAAELTKQLLTFARRDVATREPTDVVEVVRGVVSMLERTLGEQIQVRLDVPDSEPLVVLAGRQQLEQIVLNLALNARDAMTNGGVLTLRVQRGALGEVIFEVRDTGTGMSDEVLSHVFEPFFTTKPHGEGTGLGLATVYGIVRRNDGDIRIESEEGIGTTVRVTLREIHEPARQHNVPAPLVAPGSERILLVEDEPALRRATARILTDHGYEVSVARDGVEALELIDASSTGFDLVLSDYAMPRMGGAELAGLLKERGDTMPILFVSGYEWGTAPLVGRSLAKPVEQDDLLKSVREVLDE